MSIVDECKKCDAYCCKHVAVHIDKPVNKKGFDHIRWYLLHENVWVSIDLEGDWVLEFRSPCKKITEDFKCGDYDNRPIICKTYPGKNELCERQSDQLSYLYLFTNVEEFELYLKSKKHNQQKRIKK
jgi:Fe-S-cluster containining protein